jgi:DNA-binding NarL/FixJ family response regulator
MNHLRVLIADDHLLFRDGLRALLASAEDTDLVGEASAGEEAVALAASLQPDIVLMDVQMPGVNGIDATRQIVHMSPHIGVLVVTMFEDDHSVFAAMQQQVGQQCLQAWCADVADRRIAVRPEQMAELGARHGREPHRQPTAPPRPR